MAIQFRRGDYEDFQPSKMVAGEPAVVQSGDSTTTTGKGVYICFAPGDVQRLATYEEMTHDIETAMEGSQAIQEYIQDEVDAQLAEHPEWTTTVEDGAITYAKLASGLVVDNATTADATKLASANVAKGLQDQIGSVPSGSTLQGQIDTLNSNTSVTSSVVTKLYLAKSGNLVAMTAGSALAGRTWTAYESILIGTIPSGYRPAREVNYAVSTSNTGIILRCIVQTGGNVYINNPGGAISSSISIATFCVTFSTV